ncbi:hypothetical protein GGX14DRAFT_610022 [Mycena pura]|uniref:Uncharacterized protein n=1 Tax=Mycena pura TaxID=153505 RepID=A0AAD6YG11_9AGAR|nr:hypothetical protein GGX14DRAFT_610022 [Mycena pura]
MSRRHHPSQSLPGDACQRYSRLEDENTWGLSLFQLRVPETTWANWPRHYRSDPAHFPVPASTPYVSTPPRIASKRPCWPSPAHNALFMSDESRLHSAQSGAGQLRDRHSDNQQLAQYGQVYYGYSAGSDAALSAQHDGRYVYATQLGPEQYGGLHADAAASHTSYPPVSPMLSATEQRPGSTSTCSRTYVYAQLHEAYRPHSPGG